jgi:hypothetical protein
MLVRKTRIDYRQYIAVTYFYIHGIHDFAKFFSPQNGNIAYTFLFRYPIIFFYDPMILPALPSLLCFPLDHYGFDAGLTPYISGYTHESG